MAPLAAMISGRRKEPPISTSWPREMTTSLPAARVLRARSTAAALLLTTKTPPAHRAPIIMTADGTKYPIRQVSQWNFFQDMALAKVEAEALSPAPLGTK